MGNGSSEGKRLVYIRGEEYVPLDTARELFDAAVEKAVSGLNEFDERVRFFRKVTSSPAFQEALLSSPGYPGSIHLPPIEYAEGTPLVPFRRLESFFAACGLSDFWQDLPDTPGKSLADVQCEAVARYLTTAPEIPRIVRRFQNGFGAPPEEKLPPNWGPDDLVRWICEKTDHNIGKGFLTPEGYQRARELYEPKDPVAVFFRTAPRLQTGGGALVGRGFHPLSLAELLQVQPDTRDWPALSPAQRNMCANYIRPRKVAEGQTYSDPHPEELWTRYQVHTGALPHDFNLVALMRLVLDARDGRVELNPDPPEVDPAPVSDARVYDAMKYLKITDANPRFRLMLLVAKGALPQDFTTAELLIFWRSRGGEWTKEGYDWARENGLLDEGHPVASGTVKAQGHLAADVGAVSWQELEFLVQANGVKFRRVGKDERFTEVNWAGVGLTMNKKATQLLIRIAEFGGTCTKLPGDKYPRDTVFDLNEAFRGSFGLPDSPFQNNRWLGVQAAVGKISLWQRK